MTDKSRLCVHCGHYIVLDGDVAPCMAGGSAHRECEHLDREGDHSWAT